MKPRPFSVQNHELGKEISRRFAVLHKEMLNITRDSPLDTDPFYVTRFRKFVDDYPLTGKSSDTDLTFYSRQVTKTYESMVEIALFCQKGLEFEYKYSNVQEELAKILKSCVDLGAWMRHRMPLDDEETPRHTAIARMK